MAWAEGITSSKNILHDLAKILTTSNVLDDGTVDASRNWALEYPAGLADINASGNIILKTTTSAIPARPGYTGATSTTMYLEIKKDEFVVNPENGLIETDDSGNTIPNHYYLKMRIYKNLNTTGDGPDLLIPGDPPSDVNPLHCSEWSKLSWYVDFKEVLNDTLDTDAGTEDVRDGVVFKFIKTPGIYEDLPIQYWISCDNDRVSMVVMGEPSIDFNNYLSGFAYIGKIDSFEEGVADVEGNFALTTSSSTVPAYIKVNENQIQISDFNINGELLQAYDYSVTPQVLIPTLGGMGTVYASTGLTSTFPYTHDTDEDTIKIPYDYATDANSFLGEFRELNSPVSSAVISISGEYSYTNGRSVTTKSFTGSFVESTGGATYTYNINETDKVIEVNLPARTIPADSTFINIKINLRVKYDTKEIGKNPELLITTEARKFPTGKKTNTHSVSYRVIGYNLDGKSKPTNEIILGYTHDYVTSDLSKSDPVSPSYSLSIKDSLKTQYQKFSLKFTNFPHNINGIKIYRKDIKVIPTTDKEPDETWLLVEDIPVSEIISNAKNSSGTSVTLSNISEINPTDGNYYTYIDRQDGVQSDTDVLNLFGDNDLGVIRDYITGSVLRVKGPEKWGKNTTATGVLDISMYQTRSGVYFQRHLASFITPEEYMDKEVFNPSRWTNKFHLSPIYVVHGYDGYRGYLNGVVAVDESSIVHLDELVVNKGKPNEDYYKYFRIKAPFSILSSSPNGKYGIAIKKGDPIFLTYDGNGNDGGVVPPLQRAYYGLEQLIVGNIGSLTNSGYTFSGWNTADDGSGIDYTAGSTIILYGNTKLYAKWT